MKITLANIAQATEQQVFDQVAKHLLKQNARSMYIDDGMPGCAYRGDDGMMCAGGCLIADDEYSIDMEDTSWDQLGIECSERVEKVITALQVMHDDLAPHRWPAVLESIAYEYGLEWKF